MLKKTSQSLLFYFIQVEAEEGPEEVFAKVEQIFDSLLKEGTHT